MRAVLDANVLLPRLTRELILAAARLGHLEPRWSARLLAEWERAAGRDGAAAAALARLQAAALARDWPAACVDPAPIAARLPDPADLHVLAACVAAGADTLVTRNHRDFPARELARHGVVRQDPDPLLRAIAAADPRYLSAARGILAGFGAPARDLLKAAHLPRLARLIA
jgi:predicted nucleic acid-binding protein